MKSRTKGNTLSFMTWNLYLGADITPIISASESGQLSTRIAEVFRQFLLTNFHARAKAIARQIANEKPDVIGLQEVELFQILFMDIPIFTYDFMAILLRELHKEGLQYHIAAMNNNFSVNIPTNHTFFHFVDRDAILIRQDARLRVINKESQHFVNNLHVQVSGYEFEILRGYSFVDIRKNNMTFRVINTHLEAYDDKIQLAQGDEILMGPANTCLPKIILGDLNSEADGSGTPTYQQFIKKGFNDIWVKVGKGPGNTCCQQPDLLNKGSTLTKRIDYILYNTEWKPISTSLVGEKEQDKTSTNLWPSDHAGVLGRFSLKN